MKRRARWGLGGAMVLAVGGLSTAASADVVDGGATGNGFTHNGANLTVGIPTHAGVDRRDTNSNPNWISYHDCTAGAVLSFVATPLTMSTADGTVSSFEVWVAQGTSTCIDSASRDGTICKQILAKNSPANKMGVTVDIRGKEDLIVKGLGQPSCDFQHDSSAIPVKVYFLLKRGNNPPTTADGDYTTWEGTEVDLWGPDKPDAPAVTAGDGNLSLTLTPGGSDTTKFWVFRDPPPDATLLVPTTGAGGGGGGTGGAGGGTGGTSGVGGSGGSSNAACPPSDILVPGAIPSSYLQDRIATTADFPSGATSASTTLKDLTNNVNYRVAVAGLDLVGNIGKLSDVACGVPKPVDSFFKVYCQDGGTCTGCSFGTDHGFAWPALASGALVVVGLGVRRRRRARRAASAGKAS